MAANTLLFTFVSGLVLLVITVGVLRLRHWRHAAPTVARPAGFDVAATRVVRSPTTWTLTFLLLVLVTVAGTLALVGAFPVPEDVVPAVGSGLLAVAALVAAGFVFVGVYSSVRDRGYGTAPAVGLASLFVGLLALVVVVAQLFLG